MKYAVLVAGLFAAALFIYSIYLFAVDPDRFKPVAYAFLGISIVFFLLVIIRKVRDDRELRKKLDDRDTFGKPR
jgi:uncharacterized membrane protein